MNEKLELLTIDLLSAIRNLPEGCDIADFGNEVGIAVAKAFKEELGWEKGDFLSGIEHGVSLVDGSHDSKKTCGRKNGKK